MNIKFGIDNFYTRYLKRFLSSELSYSNKVLGKFNKDDQKMLIQYLNLPNIKDTFEAVNLIKNEFEDIDTYFTNKIKDNEIVFVGKDLSQEIVDYISDNINNISKFCESLGWSISEISEWIDTTKDLNNDGIIDNNDVLLLIDMVNNPTSYTQEELAKGDLNYDGYLDQLDIDILSDYIASNKIGFTITKSNRKNYFPNKDMLVFVNQFDGTFMYNYSLRDGFGADDVPHLNPNKDTKLGVYKCKPGQKLTITHNSDKHDGTRIVIGCTPATMKSNFVNFICENVVDVTLKPGEYVEYTTTSSAEGLNSNAEYVLIQVPSNYEQLTNGGEVTVTLDVGDINFDGKIDLLDYYMLAEYTATGPGAETLPHNKVNWTPTSKQLAVMNIDTDSAEINTQDAIKLYKYIKGDGSVPPLGFVYYTYNDPEVEPTSNNVSNLLIIDGHYDKEINIPFADFVKDDWIVHEKFYNYLLNMAIHPYSDSENITYLQKLLKEIYPTLAYNKSYFYNGIYNDNIRNLVREYQKTFTNYTVGDLNLDGKINQTDLDLLQPLIDDYKDIYLLQDYLDNKTSLTPEEYTRLDVDHNGVVDGRDLEILLEQINTKYSEIFLERADINNDGFYNQEDYIALQNEVNGLTNNLQNYTIPFILGYLDVETEAKLELDANPNGEISEVSK